MSRTDFYEKKYTYYQRTGARRYDAARYEAMAKWVSSAVPRLKPRRILDVGCGRGWMLDAIKKIYPKAALHGIEPSLENSAIARRRGHAVTTAKIGESRAFHEKFDLVFSNNVIQHSSSPVDFLAGLRDLTGDGGRIVLTCPDASAPNDEILWCDQNFSFAPVHLLALARKVGLHVVRWEMAPTLASLLHKQLVVLSGAGASKVTVRIPRFSKSAAFRAKSRYLKSWGALDDRLMERVSKFERVYNFGASMWSSLLAGYAPSYWVRVQKCTIDGMGGTFCDKTVVAFKSLNPAEKDCVVLGINPTNQAAAAARFQGVNVVRWDDLIES